MKSSQVKSIRALSRGIEVLRVLQNSGAMSLHALHDQTHLPKATLLRILKTLHEQGMIWQRMADNAYVPSYSLSELAGRLDQENALVEVASPILEQLSSNIRWPSVLAVPRLGHMEVIETNASRAYFDDIPLGPIGFQVNMLRSASGRAFLSFCEEPVRDAMLERLRRSDRKGDRLARNPDYIQRLINQTRDRGFALRDRDFGGDYDEPRAVADDLRDSLGVPIRLGQHVPGAINVTWSLRAQSRERAIELLAGPVIQAADQIALVLSRGA